MRVEIDRPSSLSGERCTVVFVRPTNGKRNCDVRHSTPAAHLHDSMSEAMMSLGTGRRTKDFAITSRIELARQSDWPSNSPWNAERVLPIPMACGDVSRRRAVAATSTPHVCFHRYNSWPARTQ
jgi:hypothetical protein